MAKFRKKPVVVEAMRIDLDDREATRRALEFMGATPGEFDMPLVAGKACWWRQSFPNGRDQPPTLKLVIHTLEEDMEAGHGDWIIRGVNGEFYPCKPDIFAKTYEPAE